jgi:hypothetical protein
MTFQSTINYDYGFGIAGEIVRDGPKRARTLYVNTTNPANNVFGRVFTFNGDNKTVGAGGTGPIAGILANPKQHVSMGTSSGPLVPTFTLPNNVVADFAEFAKILVVLGGTKAATEGLQLQFAQADGTISVPAVAGTADANNTMFNAWVGEYSQPTAPGGLLMIKINL